MWYYNLSRAASKHSLQKQSCFIRYFLFLHSYSTNKTINATTISNNNRQKKFTNRCEFFYIALYWPTTFPLLIASTTHVINLNIETFRIIYIPLSQDFSSFCYCGYPPVLANSSGVRPPAMSHLHQSMVSQSSMGLLGFSRTSSSLLRYGGQPPVSRPVVRLM